MSDTPADAPIVRNATLIHIGDIVTPPDRQRKHFDPVKLQELENSIFDSSAGLIHAIQVVEIDGEYQLVAGERRLRAILARLSKNPEATFIYNGLSVPPYYFPVTVAANSEEVTLVEAELAENVTRADLSWQERVEAEARLHALKKKFNPTQTFAQTAALITTNRDENGQPSPNNHDSQRIKESELIMAYMDNPNVKKASNRRQAYTAAAVAAEEDFRRVLQKKITEKPLQVKTAQKETQTTEDADDNDANEDILQTPADNLILDVVYDGEKYIYGRHKLYHGDALEIFPTLPDNTFNLVITDPPYGIDTTVFGSASNFVHNYDHTDAELLYRELCITLARVCTAEAHVYIFIAANDENIFNLCRELLSSAGFKVRARPLIWHKPSRGFLTDGDSRGWRASYEQIIHARRGARPGAVVLDDVIQCDPVHPKTRVHAAQKPTALLEKLIKMSGVPGDKLLDPFVGSGSIYVAAEKASISVTGIEKNETSLNLAFDSMKGAINEAPPPLSPDSLDADILF